MKIITISIILFFSINYSIISQDIQKNLDSLSQIYNFTYEKLNNSNKFDQRYLLWVIQDLDHRNPDGKTFKQRVFLSHKSLDKPVVLVTNGYSSMSAPNPNYSNEITDILDANQIVVEHRFFPPSVPDSTIFDWKYLNIENSADDLHHIHEILKNIYRKKWLSTGISKGGQTTIYYKYYYPDDVNASVPIVAPLNFSTEEKRVYMHLNKVGNDTCREKILAFQIDLLKNKNKYLDIFSKIADQFNQTYNRAGGLEKGYELLVLEYSFAFWQWGHGCNSIPDSNSSDENKISNLIMVSSIDWVSDQGIENMQPFFYQAMTEIGMYGYDITPFKKWISFSKNPTFEFTIPKGVIIQYNPEPHQKIDCFLRHKASNMIFVVGGNDPWGSTSVDISYDTNSIKVVKKNGSHFTRIQNLPEFKRQMVINKIKEWMN